MRHVTVSLILLAFAAPLRAQTPGKPQIGGKVAPDGKTEIMCDLPATEKKRNTGGMGPRGPGSGAGLCVFTSIEYAARWQNERVLYDLQKYMTTREGGGYPQKVDSVLRTVAPGAQYGQHTGGDEAVLQAILDSGRGACVTYNGHDPHYNQSINHMVWLAAYDRKTGWACVADNNFPNEFVWMSCDEFLSRWRGSGGGWVVFLLKPPAAPVPQPWRVKP